MPGQLHQTRLRRITPPLSRPLATRAAIALPRKRGEGLSSRLGSPFPPACVGERGRGIEGLYMTINFLHPAKFNAITLTVILDPAVEMPTLRYDLVRNNENIPTGDFA